MSCQQQQDGLARLHTEGKATVSSEPMDISSLISAYQSQIAALTAKAADQRSTCTQQGVQPVAVASQSKQPEADGLPAEVPMSASRVVMHEIVLPHMGDFMSICFGGQVLSWIDICAGLAAKAVARGPCVTASVDAVHFLAPLRVGSVAIIAAMVNRTFASSMEVGVRVEEEDMRTGARTHCCSAYLTFVAVAARSSGPMMPKRKLPRVAPTSADHEVIHTEAESRRAARLAARKAGAADGGADAEAKMRLQPVTHREGGPTLAPALHTKGEGMVRGVTPGTTSAHMTQLIMPQHANSLGITFGGQVMRWMEQAAYIAASRVGRAGRHLLTASLDSVAFRHPTRVGDILYVSAQVTGIFGSSMEVLICVDGESPGGGGDSSTGGYGAGPASGVFHCGSAFATVVSVAGPWPPVAVPVPFRIVPTTDAERLRCQGAEQRRKDRLAMRKALAVHTAQRPSLDGSRSPAAGVAAAMAAHGPFSNGNGT